MINLARVVVMQSDPRVQKYSEQLAEPAKKEKGEDRGL